MGEYINRKTTIDSETGEIIKTTVWNGFDGFNATGYLYRPKAYSARFFPDTIPINLSQDAYTLLFMIAELANEENVLVRRVERKSKFSSIIYVPLDKEDMRTSTRFKYGMNKFDRCWKELTKRCIKKIQYRTYQSWAINPAVITRCKYIPFWLYEEFQDSMNPYLSARAIRKLQDKIQSYK